MLQLQLQVTPLPLLRLRSRLFTDSCLLAGRTLILLVTNQALLIDILRCEFRGTSTAVKAFLVLSLAAYSAAIGVLASIPAAKSTDGEGGSGSG